MPQSNPVGEKFMYVGCVHEASQELLDRLHRELKDPPDFLIFTGDITGSPEMETFKRLFYNHVYNRARRELGLGTSAAWNLHDSELLAHVGVNPPKQGYTLREGIIDLLTFQYQLAGDKPKEAAGRAQAHTDSMLARTIRHIATFEYYGPWVGTLPQTVRQAVVTTIEDNTQRLLKGIRPYQEVGAAVHICGGNWDRASNTQETFGSDVGVYDAIPACEQAGITFHSNIGWLETSRSLHIFLPYWSLSEWTTHDIGQFEEAALHAQACNRQDQTLVVVAHAEPNWRVHNTTSTDEATGIRKTIIDRLDNCLTRLLPDELVYPHQHNLLTREDGSELPPNTKYVLEVTEHDNVLVDNEQRFGQSNQIVASYVPYQRIGRLTIPYQGNPRPSLFGGNRHPAYVS